MQHLFSSILIIDSIIAFYLFLSPIWQRKKLDAANKALHIFALASSIWSLGFGMLFSQIDPEKAYFWRSFAVFGTVMYMISVQYLINLFAQISKEVRFLFNIVALSGFIPYILSIQRDQTEYFMSTFGMTYRFKPGPVNTLYSCYFIIVALNIVGVIIHMIRTSEKKRLRIFGKRFLLITCLILIGTVLDMIFPAIGLPALPGSNVTQFLGLIILFYAMNVLNKTRINVSNMSEFIYYSLALPVLVFDEDYHLKIVNEAASSFFKLPKEEDQLEACRMEDLFDLHSHSVFTFDEPHYSLDALCQVNNVPCNLTISKINDTYGDIIGYIVNIQNLSERMKYIEELKQARLEADSSNNAKSQFLANMSHEIRTPMNAIIGFSELALQESPSPTLTDYLEDIKMSSHNLMTLINDILDISKIESGKMTLVNIEYQTAELLHDVYEMILTQATQKGLEFFIRIDPKLPRTLYGDANRIRSILINLLNNSVKYTPAGHIQLEVLCSDPYKEPFTMEIRVSDTGIGIKEEEKEQLFEAFAQVDQTKNYGKEGTGLGLALVKGFCSLMNGSIQIESVYGEGSTFIATIEQAVRDATPLDSNLIQTHHIKDEFSLGTLRVHGIQTLIVDDNPINCKVISRSMGYYGMYTDVAGSGAMAIEMCLDKHYDLIFMDQMMPEMDGIETMQRIRALNDYYSGNEHCKIIVLTANAITGARESLLEQGFDEYLSKPINCRELEAILLHFLPKHVFEETEEQEPAATAAEAAPAEKNERRPLSALLPELNVEEGIHHCGGETEDYLEILSMVCDESNHQLSELKAYYEQKNWKDFAILAHAMKGSCLNIGAQKCAELAKGLEFAGKEQNISYIDSSLFPFEEAYLAMICSLRTALVEYGYAVGESGSIHSGNQVTAFFEEIRNSVTGFDFAGASAALKKAHMADDAEAYSDLLSQLDHLMEKMDVDQILSLLS